jgi:ABC-type polysaccharide/polyol phosphate transport system ATPase subunit
MSRPTPLLALSRLSSALDTPSQDSIADGSGDTPAVSARRVSKTFRLPHQRYSTFKERALHPFRSRTFDALRAVDDLTFEVARGEFFGIVGRNGSGKSTLLKCLAGIYQIDTGDVDVDGRLSPFIELGVGFNFDLTARENVIINGIMLGLSRRQARERFDDIIAFAELEEFVDLKLKNYSSGMQVRLAFSVAIQVDAEILLVDEVLAVGDAAFQQKCFDAFARLKAEGRTIILVTHDMSAVERFCDRALLIDRGRLQAIGAPHEIARAYHELNFGRLLHDGAKADRYGDQAVAEIVDCWFEDAEGGRVTSIAQGDAVAVCIDVRFHGAIEEPVFGISLRNEVRHTVFTASTEWTETKAGAFVAGDNARVRFAFENWLAPSRYDVTPSVARPGPGEDALDVREDVASLIVYGSRFTGGIVDVPHTIRVERR